jgi:hypothetical protein
MARSLAALRQVRLSPRLLQSEQTEVHIVVYASASPFSGIGHHSIVRCRVMKVQEGTFKNGNLLLTPGTYFESLPFRITGLWFRAVLTQYQRQHSENPPYHPIYSALSELISAVRFS